MSYEVLVDSDILIDIARSNSQTINFLSKLQKKHVLVTSVVSKMELLIGCKNKTELNKTIRFFSLLKVIPLNETISDKAVSLLKTYRLSHGLEIADSLIASSAFVHECPLLSKNKKDFRFIPDIELIKFP